MFIFPMTAGGPHWASSATGGSLHSPRPCVLPPITQDAEQRKRSAGRQGLTWIRVGVMGGATFQPIEQSPLVAGLEDPL